VVLQVPPHAGEVEDEVDAESLEVVSRPQSRQEEQPRRVDRPGAEDHLGGCARRDFCQGVVIVLLKKLLGTLDTAGDDVLVGRQSGGRLELPGEVVGADRDVLLAAGLLGLCQADQALRDDLSRLLNELMNDLTGRLDLAD
jgi:hypothetical protein